VVKLAGTTRANGAAFEAAEWPRGALWRARLL